MFFDNAIELSNINKCYRIYNRPQDRILQSFSKNKKRYDEFWALKDVSFKVKRGTTIGIIGKNGSGKSTILQIIAGTLNPTSGEKAINGRIAALLELGSGFNPEFTGRDNVIMQGTIMGLTKKQILDQMESIEKFAGIGEFIEQPIKTYSSGMLVRLAFACAVHVDPDILIVDEALAVGDMQFQLKCIEKMKSFKEQGKTILFVSHDSYSIRNFCDEVIWMMDGQVHARGDVNTVIEQYEDFVKYGLEKVEESNEKVEAIERKEHLSIDQVVFVDKTGTVNSKFKMGGNIFVEVTYTIHKPIDGLVGGVAIFDNQGTYICGLNTKIDEKALEGSCGTYKLILEYKELNLLPGTYLVDVGFFESSALIRYDYKSRVNSFWIEHPEYVAEGLVLLDHNWQSKVVAISNEV